MKEDEWYNHVMKAETGLCSCGIKLQNNRCLACIHKVHESCHGPKCCCECPCKGKKNPANHEIR